VAEPPLGQTGWPATPYGVVRPPQHISFFLFLDFFLNKICDRGILGGGGKKRSKWSNCHNLKIGGGGGGLSVTFETLEVKVQMGR
jgi:hypothetical protein